jgi:hypothetical protein
MFGDELFEQFGLIGRNFTAVLGSCNLCNKRGSGVARLGGALV